MASGYTYRISSSPEDMSIISACIFFCTFGLGLTCLQGVSILLADRKRKDKLNPARLCGRGHVERALGIYNMTIVVQHHNKSTSSNQVSRRLVYLHILDFPV